jgi:hypothetical protein
MKAPVTFSLLLLAVLCPAALAAQTNGTPFDLQGFLDREIAAGRQRIVVPPGRYRVTPRHQQHLVLRGLKDLQVIADGVEMICTETTRALTVSHCTNVTVRGLAIDYDPLPFTQGRITGLSADKKGHEIELFAGYPPAGAARNFKYEIFRPDTRTLRCDDRYPSQVEAAGPRQLRVRVPNGRPDAPEQVGDLIVIGAEFAPHGSIPHAVACDHNVNVRLENLALFASNCFGFLENDCDGSTYFRCRIDRRSPADDPVRRADPRLRSLDADAFHSTGAARGPAIIECTAKFMGDDCVNIHGDYHLIMAANGKTLRVLAKGAMNLEPGDPVELVLHTGERLPDARAVSVRPAGSITDDERSFLAGEHMDEGLRTARGGLLSRAFTVELDREVAIPRGGVICSGNRIGNGFVVKDCDFGFNRSRGILIKASHGNVSGNRIQGSRMSAILVAPEYWWLEAGSSGDLKIGGNTISDCGGVPICVEAVGGDGSIAPAGAHRDITITDNLVRECSMPGILVTSTIGLKIAHNTFESWTLSPRLPDLLRQAGLHQLQPVMRIRCGD